MMSDKNNLVGNEESPHGYGEPPVGYQQPAYTTPPPGYAGGQPQLHIPVATPYGQPPVTAQAQWMVRPESVPGVPPGLEYLTMIDQLLVHQQIELLEVFINWETSNRYVVKNSMGQQVYFAAEESDSCDRQCCGPQRGFVMHITDNAGLEVIRVNREFKCCAGVSCCAGADHCAMFISVESPPGQVIGFVKQEQSCLAPKYMIMDATENVILRIEGPACRCQAICCTEDIDFNIFSPDLSHQVGKISKQWAGYVQEAFTNADNFGITFPQDLDVKMKAVLLGANFLIDFMYFERNKQRNNGYRGY